MAWHSEMTTEREYTGSLEAGYIQDGQLLSVGSSRDKIDELWSLLRYEGIIDGGVAESLKARGVNKKQREVILQEITSYIDQAENFFRFAKNSDYRSSALLYYYSFLNLAKAAIVIDSPNLAGSNFYHGIRRKTTTKTLVKNTLQARRSRGKSVQVFNELYRLYYGVYLPDNKSFSINDILGYITDIAHDASKVSKSYKNKVHNVKAYDIVNTETNKMWTVLVCKNSFYPSTYPNKYSDFINTFERFDPQIMSLEFTYKMRKIDSKFHSFNQSKIEWDLGTFGTTPTWERDKLLRSVLNNMTQPNIYDKEVAFSITDPLRKNWQISFNEPLAIYSFMFYLSEIVRYNPVALNTYFSSSTTEGWLIKDFVESTSYYGLVALTALITKKVFIIDPRS